MKSPLINYSKISNEYDVILASGDPWYVFEIGNKIYKQQKKRTVKLIFDYRDIMTQKSNIGNEKITYGVSSPLNHFKTFWLNLKEKRLIKNVSFISTVTPVFAENIKQMINNKKEVLVVYNGFEKKVRLVKQNKPIKQILFIGSFFESQMSNLDLFIPFVIENNLIVTFVGIKKNYPSKLLNYSKKYQNIIIKDFIPKKELSELTNNTDAFLTLGYHGRSGILPVKLYEYMECGKPIIHISQEKDIISEIIKKCNCGLIFNDEEKNNFLQNLIKLNPKISEIDFYKFNNQTGILINHIENFKINEL
ncbi:glycosyltransferase [Flammeovirga pectinis]|uniref:glycosyltransferase n=1 Tax=Flammeovirga pectinis TaxID=2494373 RepID=UPI001476CCBC|nr:glycosyltransferase [Flammeovirga pectinis]